jgi:hypothetical protein
VAIGLGGAKTSAKTDAGSPYGGGEAGFPPNLFPLQKSNPRLSNPPLRTKPDTARREPYEPPAPHAPNMSLLRV